MDERRRQSLIDVQDELLELFVRHSEAVEAGDRLLKTAIEQRIIETKIRRDKLRSPE